MTAEECDCWVMDEYTREYLVDKAGHSIRSADVIEVLAELMLIWSAGPHSLRQRNNSVVKEGVGISNPW